MKVCDTNERLSVASMWLEIQC